MQLLTKIAVACLLIVSTSSETCNEDSLRECLSTLRILLEDEYTFVKTTEDEINEYCSKVQSDSRCLKEVADVCQKEHRLIAGLSATLFVHLNQVCGPGKGRQKVYLNMLPCFESHESEFKKCSESPSSDVHDDDFQLKVVCLDMNSMLCVADASRKFCGKDGKNFAESLEYGIKDSYSKVCSGTSAFKFDHYVILSIACILLFMKNR